MLALVDYGAGNLHSCAKALERAASEIGYKGEIKVTSEARDIANASRIVLPGVGAFGDCLAGLNAVSGMKEALQKAVHTDKKPFLGICVGMQLLATTGLEHGVHHGLDWIKGEIDLITPADSSLKIPHMGWNTLNFTKTHAILNGIDKTLHAYFVHSYHFTKVDQDALLATSDYGGAVTAMIAKDNIIGTQFHPEKSQKLGLALLGNFLKWKP